MKEFYKKNNLIFSNDFSIPLRPRGIWKVSNHFHIKKKIWLKWYIWLSKIKEKIVKINKLYFYNKLNWEYEKWEIDVEVIFKIEKLIEEKFNIKNSKFWIEINFLSEVPKWHWLGFSGVFASLFSSILFFIFNKGLEEQFYKNFIENIKDTTNQNILNLSYEIESIFRYWKTNWTNSLISFFSTNNPILFFEKNNELKFQKIWEEDFIFPLDYYIIFSWIPLNTKRLELDITKWVSKWKWIKKFFSKNNNFYDLEKKYWKKINTNEKIEELFISLFNILNFKLLNSLELLLEDYLESRNIENFISIINEYKNFRYFLWEYLDFLNIFEKMFYKNKKSLKNEIWIMSVYWWKIWWWLLVVSKENTNRRVIQKTIDNIQDYYPNSYIEYCSYEDNKKIEWIKLVHDIENNIFHKSLIWENYKLKTNKKTIIVSNFEEALEKDFDLIFDNIKGKVYLKGKKLTSKEIHSQNILVEVVLKLFDMPWIWVKNKKLNKTSYSETKSLMWAKVIYPFRKLIKKELNKEVEFDIAGIGWDFEIKLDFWKIKVGILDKI